MRGIGTQVKVTVSSRNGLRPQMSDRAPIKGALRNESKPYTTCTSHTVAPNSTAAYHMHYSK